MNFANLYEQVIQSIGDGTGASDALLHVHAGMVVLLAARLVTGRSLATPIPFAVVCVAELANEILDRMSHGSWLWADTSLDVINTLVWPFVLMIGLRVRRSQEGKRQGARPQLDLAESQQRELAG
jgi:hypothetical protein